MQSSSVFDAILLGFVESLTEFLPVSSTGHLILVSDVLGFHSPGNVFQVVIQFGAVLAICVLYFRRLSAAVIGLPTDPGARRFAASVLLAFLPAAVVGALMHGIIKTVLFSPLVVGCSLLVGGVAILLVEHWRPAPRLHAANDLPLAVALGIGLAQILALVPGVSRSGATIMGALLLGVDRKPAAEFSFFLAIPTMLGAAVYDLYKNRAILEADGMALIAVGFIAAFITALIVVEGLLRFVQRYSYRAFGWYRIGAGITVLGTLGYYGLL